MSGTSPLVEKLAGKEGGEGTSTPALVFTIFLPSSSYDENIKGCVTSNKQPPKCYQPFYDKGTQSKIYRKKFLRANRGDYIVL